MPIQSNHSAAIILAAGKGTRMVSDLPKVLHPVAGVPMLAHVMEAARLAGCARNIIVTSPYMPDVANTARSIDEQTEIALQHQQRGTGDAVLAAKEALESYRGNLIVLFGDSPLILPETISKMLSELQKAPELAAVILGFEKANPPAYGRLIIENGELLRIVEAKDASAEELAVTACNAGVMALRGELAWELLAQLDDDNAQGELYLTDIVAIARRSGYRCAALMADETQALGVNSRAELAEVEARMQARLREAAMRRGVSMHDPSTVYLCADTRFGKDVTLQPNVVFGPGVAVGERVEIRSFSHIEGAVIGDDATIGPFARLRPGSNIGEDCKIGNFVEIKKAVIEQGAKVSHLSYIGDAHIGENSNIGAGTITCNYDGYRKYHTEIGRDVFVGSNTALVAPVVIGHGAMIAAGSVVTEDVKDDSLALARSRQSQKEEWAAAFRERMKKP